MTLVRQQALLKRIETTLPHKDAVQHINDIIDLPNAPAIVERMDSVSLFRLIKAAGFDQGVDLIPYATPQQVQTFVDFDVWRRDRMITERFHRWLDAVIDGMDSKRFKVVMRDLDSEVIALYVKQGLVVEPIEEGQIPEHMPMHTERSPDGVYAIAYPEDETYATVLRKLIKRLYEEDRVLAWTLLEAARWELASEMEEFAYRWRQGRLEEEGFVPREEAMAVYRPLDPAKLREGFEDKTHHIKTRLNTPRTINVPSVITSEFAGEYYILEMLDKVQDDQAVHELVFELTNLCNRTMIADGIEPGELDSGRQVIRRTLGYISVGLMFVSQGDDEQAIAALDALALRDLLRAGYTMASRLQHQALQLTQRPTLTLTDDLDYSLLNPEEESLIESLIRQRPTYASSPVDFDIFRNQQQIDDAALKLGLIAFKQLWLFGMQRHSVQSLAQLIYNQHVLQSPESVTFDMCFTTAIARALIGQAPSIDPLRREEVGQLFVVLRSASWQEQDVHVFDALAAQMPAAMLATTQSLLKRWLKRTFDHLAQAFGVMQDDELHEQHIIVLQEQVLMQNQ